MADDRTQQPSSLTFFGSDLTVARRVARPMSRFLHVEAASGVLLIAATVLALVWANSPLKDSYHDLWETRVVVQVGSVVDIESHAEVHEEDEAHGAGEAGSATAAEGGSEPAVVDTHEEAGAEDEHGSDLPGISLEEFVNDALMAIFFFVVGMEIKMELVNGQLRDRRAAILPAMAALGGMVVPAALFVAVNWGGDVEGWGIPMATDIAFAIGVLSLLGSRVPVFLKVFLLTLAIVDDIGAILVIALFYTEEVSFGWLALAVALLVGMFVMQKFRVWYVPIYAAVGFFVWYAVFESGVHATIAGVAMGLLTPARPLQKRPAEIGVVEAILTDDNTEVSAMRRAQFEIRETVSVAERLIEMLHPWTSFFIIPVFALANAGIELSNESLSDAATSPVTLGVVLGLVVGKLVGITAFSALTLRLGLSELPRGLHLKHLAGVGAIAGIGFTVSIFITGLAYDDPFIQDEAKIGILVGSILAAIVGSVILWRTLHPVPDLDEALEVSADF
ncbi:MAG: Na+/H+ antiporter NhaA [Acidimicrobiales bacterium]